MKLRYFKHSSRKQSSGFFAIYLAITLITLLLIAGYAIDSGNLFIKQRQLNRSLDMAALSAGRFLLEEPNDVVETRALEIARENLLLNGIDPDEATINPVVSIDSDTNIYTLEITGSLNTPLYLLDVIPESLFGDQTVGALAAVEKGNAINGTDLIAVVILDNSGSMGNDMDELRDGYQEFLEHFRAANKTELQFVIFNYYFVPLNPMGTPLVDEWMHLMDDIEDTNGTQMLEPMDYAIDLIERRITERANLDPTDPDYLSPSRLATLRKSIILFTDGGPKTQRWPSRRGLDMDDADIPLGPGNPFYEFWADSWNEHNLYQPVQEDTTYLPRVPLEDIHYQDDYRCTMCVCPTCEKGYLCHPKNWIPWPAMEMMVGASDYARQQGITVHTVGLGTQNTTNPNCADSYPYQGPLVGFEDGDSEGDNDGAVMVDGFNGGPTTSEENEKCGMRRYFLKRVANDPDHYSEAPEGKSFGEVCDKLLKTEDLNQLPQGSAQFTEDADGLRPIFDMLGEILTKEIRVRLTK